MVNVLDCDSKVSNFELPLHFYVHFWTDTLREVMNPLISTAMD